MKLSLGRREFLARVTGAGLGLVAGDALSPLLRAASAKTAPIAPPDLGFIERCDRPPQWETQLASLDGQRLTPNELFFVRSHFMPAEVDAADWKLEITGRVHTPLTLTLDELTTMPRRTETAVLECAGNGRGLMPLPSTSGTQWAYGAVGCAAWSGVALSDLLHQAGLEPDAKHVWFEAADQAPMPETPRFVRSIPIAKAMQDVVMAYGMNGEPLPMLHGYPLRAVVPGWYGMAWPKWVTRIRVEAEPSDNHFMARSYHWNAPGVDPASAPPVETLRIKSLITYPRNGVIGPGNIPVRGIAWAGPSRVWMVETSTDGGASWFPANMQTGESPYEWTRWNTTVLAQNRGPLTIMVRATDGRSARQPVRPSINAGGYGNNAIHAVTIDVRA